MVLAWASRNLAASQSKVRHYGATNVVPTQKDRPLPHVEEVAPILNLYISRRENLCQRFDEVRSQNDCDGENQQ